MAVKSLAEIAAFLNLPVLTTDVQVTGLSLSTATLMPGQMFVALPGAHAHGAGFAAQAKSAGAVAVLTDPSGQELLRDLDLPVLIVPDLRSHVGELASWFHDYPSSDLLVAGVTGTNGKTTSTYFIESALSAAGLQTGMIGTVETKVGAERWSSTRTTPEATDLQALFDRMRSVGVTGVAMEVSSHALALGRVSGTHFAVSGFTNLSQDHLDFHGSMEEYFHAKARLFTDEYSASAVVNVDDAYGRELLAMVSIPALSTSIEGPADWYLSDITASRGGSNAVVHAPDGSSAPLVLHMPGRFNLSNALIAIACAGNLGVSMDSAIAGAQACMGVPGRMQRVDVGQEFLAIVDYAHTPDAVATLLATVRELTAGRVITVLGCGGDRDQGKRRQMGLVAARDSDLAVFTNDNPRSEDPMAIIAAMLAGAAEVAHAQVLAEPDRAAAIALAVAQARAGDVVVIAGKGHEQGQEVAGVISPFDDREVLRQAMLEVLG